MVKVKYTEPMKRFYNIRVDEEDWKMIRYLRGEKVELPLMLREHIREIYRETVRKIDDDIYGL
jgi:hypothetical protein